MSTDLREAGVRVEQVNHLIHLGLRASRAVIISGLSSGNPARAKIATVRDQALGCPSLPRAVARHSVRLESARLNFGARRSCEKPVIRAAFPLVRKVSFDG